MPRCSRRCWLRACCAPMAAGVMRRSPTGCWPKTSCGSRCSMNMTSTAAGSVRDRNGQHACAAGMRRSGSACALAHRCPPICAADRYRAASRSIWRGLRSVTGHPIRLDDTNPNFFVYIVNEDERRALGPAIAADLARPDRPGDLAGITQLPRSDLLPCLCANPQATAAPIPAPLR